MSGEQTDEGRSPDRSVENWPRAPAGDDDWLRRDRAFRGISVRLAVHYLENLGGEVVARRDSDAAGTDDDSHDTSGDDSTTDSADDTPKDGSTTDSADDATVPPAAVVDGDGWRATLSTSTVGIGPTVSLTEVRVAFAGDPDGLDDLIDRFAQKAMRAGG